MLYMMTSYTEEPFLLRSPEEIQEELAEILSSVEEADNHIARLQTAREELLALPLSGELAECILPQLVAKGEELRHMLSAMLEETEALGAELEDTLYALGYENE